MRVEKFYRENEKKMFRRAYFVGHLTVENKEYVAYACPTVSREIGATHPDGYRDLTTEERALISEVSPPPNDPSTNDAILNLHNRRRFYWIPKQWVHEGAKPDIALLYRECRGLCDGECYTNGNESPAQILILETVAPVQTAERAVLETPLIMLWDSMTSSPRKDLIFVATPVQSPTCVVV